MVSRVVFLTPCYVSSIFTENILVCCNFVNAIFFRVAASRAAQRLPHGFLARKPRNGEILHFYLALGLHKYFPILMCECKNMLWDFFLSAMSNVHFMVLQNSWMCFDSPLLENLWEVSSSSWFLICHTSSVLLCWRDQKAVLPQKGILFWLVDKREIAWVLVCQVTIFKLLLPPCCLCC